MKTIPMYKPLIEEDEINAAREALEMGWLGMGSYVAEFEKEIKKYISAEDRYVVAVNTGTSALHLAMLLAKVEPGDEVITPSFNNVGDFQAILAAGAKPVFCDIDENTLCIDVEKAQEMISPKTKAIIAMDYGCMLCDHNSALELAKMKNIRLIHDAAHSFGSKYNGKPIGSFSDICIFSFDPVKNITCIDGGALVVKTEEEAIQLHEMRLIGMTQPSTIMYKNERAWTYDVKNIGFRYHLSNLHAAIGLSQLKKIHKISENRRKAAIYLNSNLMNIDELIIPKTDFNNITPFSYFVRVRHDLRDDFRQYLLHHGIETGIHWQPGHWFSLFKNCKKGDLSITEKIAKEIVSLPINSNMTHDELDRIVNSVKMFFS